MTIIVLWPPIICHALFPAVYPYIMQNSKVSCPFEGSEAAVSNSALHPRVMVGEYCKRYG